MNENIFDDGNCIGGVATCAAIGTECGGGTLSNFVKLSSCFIGNSDVLIDGCIIPPIGTEDFSGSTELVADKPILTRCT